MTEEQKKLKAERNKRYREKKKAAKLEKDLQAPIDDPAPESAMQAEIEKAPESAMQTPSNEKQSGQLLSDAAFSYYLTRQNHRK